MRCLRQDPTTLFHVVAVQTHDERFGGRVAEDAERGDDAVRDGVARGDAAEDVHEHALHLRVAEDDVEAVGHDLGRGAAADVEEVGGLHAAVALTGVGDDVERRHDEPRAVADDADLAVELDVVQPVGLRLRLERVLAGGVLEVLVALVAEVGVLVERDLAVECQDLAVAGADQGVDLDEGRVLALVDVVELDEDVGDGVLQLRWEVRLRGDLERRGLVDAGQRVDLDPGECLGLLDGELLDLHAALDAGEREVGAVGPVEQHGEVELLGDVGTLGDHDPLDGVALDVEAEDGLRVFEGLVRGLRDLDAAGLAATADLHLRLDDHDAADLLGRRLRLLGGVGDDPLQHGDAVGLEEVPGLILEKIHAVLLPARFVRSASVSRSRTPHRGSLDVETTAATQPSAARWTAGARMPERAGSDGREPLRASLGPASGSRSALWIGAP
ncbi:Predicted hydrolase or acyltransferase (Modular protein) (fragment) [Curtobacterium sp. 8I-2]